MVSRKQKQAPKMKDENGNEIEMPNMLTMNITMPILSGWISASVPQSMGLYWFINSFLQIIIQLYTDMTHKKDDNKTNNNVIIEAKNLEKETEEIEDSNEEKKEKKNKDGSNINSSKKKKKNKKK
jgi:membrane protein insertase Oxa1/YidC/SpoIIIJ